jgi:hypothetical protein
MMRTSILCAVKYLRAADLYKFGGIPVLMPPPSRTLHVWAWENNPKGSCGVWNTAVTCDEEAGDPTVPR